MNISSRNKIWHVRVMARNDMICILYSYILCTVKGGDKMKGYRRERRDEIHM